MEELKFLDEKVPQGSVSLQGAKRTAERVSMDFEL